MAPMNLRVLSLMPTSCTLSAAGVRRPAECPMWSPSSSICTTKGAPCLPFRVKQKARVPRAASSSPRAANERARRYRALWKRMSTVSRNFKASSASDTSSRRATARAASAAAGSEPAATAESSAVRAPSPDALRKQWAATASSTAGAGAAGGPGPLAPAKGHPHPSPCPSSSLRREAWRRYSTIIGTWRPLRATSSARANASSASGPRPPCLSRSLPR
mmetsp:Transcript_4579/g.15066  ORF Transcript_4579/g.15066 Transcript_4579/m.15066 type:complete len:218 (-) Transcript_4579:74-727(-)